MQRLVFLNRFYWPDVAATGQMLTDLAEGLAARGWSVTVVTGRAGYATRARLPRRETHNGVQIVRVGLPQLGQGRLLTRVVDYAGYLGGATLRLLRGEQPGVVVAMTDPPFLVGVAVLVRRLRGSVVVHWVQDLFPETAVRLGVIRADGPVAWLSRRLAIWLHRRADETVVLGRCMAEVADESLRSDRPIRIIENWTDVEALTPSAADRNDFRELHGLSDRFVVMYSGNAGRAHCFEGVLGAARSMAGDGTTLFLFIGGGVWMPRLRSEVAAARLSNVAFLPYVPRAELSRSLAAADVSLVTEKPEAAGCIVPSKTYGILASGRPVVFIGSQRSDVADTVRAADCGYVVDPWDTDGLVSVLEELRDDPRLRASLGARARRAAEDRYGRERGVEDWHRLLAAVLNSPDTTARRLVHVPAERALPASGLHP